MFENEGSFHEFGQLPWTDSGEESGDEIPSFLHHQIFMVANLTHSVLFRSNLYRLPIIAIC